MKSVLVCKRKKVRDEGRGGKKRESEISRGHDRYLGSIYRRLEGKVLTGSNHFGKYDP